MGAKEYCAVSREGGGSRRCCAEAGPPMAAKPQTTARSVLVRRGKSFIAIAHFLLLPALCVAVCPDYDRGATICLLVSQTADGAPPPPTSRRKKRRKQARCALSVAV